MGTIKIDNTKYAQPLEYTYVIGELQTISVDALMRGYLNLDGTTLTKWTADRLMDFVINQFTVKNVSEAPAISDRSMSIIGEVRGPGYFGLRRVFIIFDGNFYIMPVKKELDNVLDNYEKSLWRVCYNELIKRANNKEL